MADNVTLNSGSGGSTLSTDEVTRATVVQHVQYVKLMNGTDGAIDVIPGEATNGLDVDVTRLPSIPAGTNNIGDVDVLTLPALPAGTNNIGDVDILSIAAGDNNIGNVDVVTLPALPAGTNNIGDVDVLTLPSLPAGTNNIGDVDVLTLPAATNAGATAKTSDYDTGAGTDTVTMFGLALPGAGGAVQGGTSTNPVRTDPTGTTTQPVSGTVTANLAAGTNNIGDVDVLTLPALPAGTNNIGDVDILSIAAGDNNIGNVDIVTMPNVTLAAGTNTNEVVGDAAHDAVVAGNPVLVAASSETMADSAPANRVSADGDATRVSATDGALFVIPTGPQSWSYHSDGSTALTDASVHAAPGAGLSLYVTDIVVSSGAATAMNVFFEEGATKVLGPYYLEAVAGRGFALHFGTPKKITANTALTVTTSAAIAHCVDVTGFTAPG